MIRQSSLKLPNIELHENSSIGSGVVPYVLTDERKELTKEEFHVAETCLGTVQ
jgi:hypothetical protein